MEINSMAVVKPISLGPWGGQGGSKWTQNKDGESTLAGIIICYEGRIDSIVFKSVHEGKTDYTKELGHNFGLRMEKVMLDYPQEYVKSVSGYYGPLDSGQPVTIRSLTFVTNVTKYGPIGPEQGTPFTLAMEGGTIVGFHGRSGDHLDAIGVYVKPTVLVRKEEASSGQTHVPRLSSGKELMASPGAGPWGGAAGRPFDDGVFSGIRNIYVQRDNTLVHSILIEYDRTGQSVRRKYGGEGGDITDEVCLDYPKECLISISGFYGKFEGYEVIKSLSFNTTKCRHGPFGNEIGLFFTAGEVPAKIVGFHGRSGLYLNAIGVLREYFKFPNSS